MDFAWRVRGLTIGVILFVLVVSSPVFGVVDLTPEQRDPDGLGGGTATVTVESDPVSDLRIDRGRFGTGVYYLRVPPAVVDVAAVEQRPQLTYKIHVSGLDYTKSTSTVLQPGQTGRLTLTMRDRAFAPDQLENSSYRAEVLVRVQSFDMDEVVYRKNTTVTVRE